MKAQFKTTKNLIPAIIQDIDTKVILMLGYMNEKAIKLSEETGNVHFFSRSKNRIWKKGEKSNNVLKIINMKLDCDNDTILIQANPKGPICHKGTDTCWAKENKGNFLNELESIIASRKKGHNSESYTSMLFEKGLDKILQKIGEESSELIIASKNEELDNFKNEAADLLFHFLVLLSEKQISLIDIVHVLQKRNNR
jgi:phosphoribosyl-ATP pyrophosphohydrolase/phosphoribosyl-AMP cyclohydrolase